MKSHGTKKTRLALALGVAALALASVAAKNAAVDTAHLAYADGRLLEVDAAALGALPPADSGKIILGARAADAIIGWYDKGNNYHAQHMKVQQQRHDAPAALAALEGRDLSQTVAR